MDPRQIIDQLLNGELESFTSQEPHDVLVVCEQALGEGHFEIAQALQQSLTDAESEFINFRKSQLDNDAESAQIHITNSLEISRKSEQRDHLLEARIRMEWGLLRATLGEHTEAGVDLKWAVDRFSALSKGHRWHGLSLLNMATWHENRGEYGMALAMHADISRHGPHCLEIIAMSRRHAAEIFVAKGHMASAIRNMWIACHGFRQCDMDAEAVEAGLQWIDLGLGDVSDEAPTMDTVVESASPRSIGEPNPRAWINPCDLQELMEWLDGNVDEEIGLELLQEAQSVFQS